MKTAKIITGTCMLLSAVAFPETVTREGSTLTIDVGGAESYTYPDEIGSDVTELVKSGSGTLVLNRANPGFTGSTAVSAGVLKVSSTNAVGNGGRVTVANGACLEASFALASPDTVGFSGTVEISGSGPDGTGALRYTDSSSIADSLFSEVKLAGGSLVGGTGRWGALTWDLNGCTLTNRNGNQFMFYGATVKNPGHFVHDAAQRLTVINKTSAFGGGASNTFTVVNTSSSSMISFWYAAQTKIPWTLRFAEGMANAYLNAFGTSYTGWGWSGPVELGSTLLHLGWASGNAKTYHSLSGPVDCLNGAGGVGGVVQEGVQPTLESVLSGEWHDFRYLTAVAGLMTVTGGTSHVYGSINDAGSSMLDRFKILRFADAKTVTVTNGNARTESSRSGGYAPARLEISGDTEFSFLRKSSFLSAGGSAGMWGIVKATGGATLTNCNMCVGKGANAAGAFYLKDSTLYSDAGPGYDGAIGFDGEGAYGYWGLSNSTVKVNGYTTLAYGQQAAGFIVQHGGSTEMLSRQWRIGHGGYAHVRVDGGGVFRYTAGNGPFELGAFYAGFKAGTHTGGVSVLTVADGALADFYNIYVYSRTNSLSQINLNSRGTLNTTDLWTLQLVRPEGAVFNVSFDGGTWKRPSNGNVFYVGDRDTRPGQTVVHNGGARIDVPQGVTGYWNAPLEKPTGRVVSSITLPQDAAFLASTNIGPLRVEISGIGHMASAFLAFDDEKEEMDRIIVESPGTGYDAGTTARVIRPGDASVYACGVETAEAAGGGIVKLGAGTLKLTAVNTYAAGTTVSNGTLEATAHGSIPANQPLAVAADGTFDYSTNAVTVSVLSGTGSVKGSSSGSLTAGGVAVDAADLDAGAYLRLSGTVTITGSITLGNAELLDRNRAYTVLSASAAFAAVPGFSGLPPGWVATLADGGKKVALKFNKGIVVILL